MVSEAPQPQGAMAISTPAWRGRATTWIAAMAAMGMTYDFAGGECLVLGG